MSYGLVTYKADGSEQLRVTDRLTRIHSFNTHSMAASSSLTVAVAGMSTDGTWAAFSNKVFSGVEIAEGSYTVKNGHTTALDIVVIVVRL